jgi:hypothetical protein
MSQEAGTSGTPKIYFLMRHHFHVYEWLAMPQHSESSTQGSMGSYSHCPGIPTSYSPARGDQVLAFCTPQDWTGNLTVNSPTLQPLNQVADEISCLMCLYIAQDVPGLQENSKIKNLNFVNIGIRTQYLGVVCVEQTP